MFSREEILRAAEKIGAKVEFNSKQPGYSFGNDIFFNDSQMFEGIFVQNTMDFYSLNRSYWENVDIECQFIIKKYEGITFKNRHQIHYCNSENSKDKEYATKITYDNQEIFKKKVA